MVKQKYMIRERKMKSISETSEERHVSNANEFIPTTLKLNWISLRGSTLSPEDFAYRSCQRKRRKESCRVVAH